MTNKLTEKQIEIYKERFKEEFELISEKGFTKYFLIIEDVVTWAKENGIAVGPSRGSAGNCLISYLLNITTIDPIEYNLPFSRFLNKERVSAPDIDLDFCKENRHLIKERLQNLYGVHKVSGIPTFFTLKDKAVIKKIATAYEIPFFEANKFTDLIDETIEDALEKPEGKIFAEKYPHIIKHSLILRGTVSGLGTHAAGLVICKDSLKDSPTTHIMHGPSEETICWSKDDAEEVGNLKIDSLGLVNLTIIDKCLKLIKKNYDKEIDINSLPVEDKNVFDDINKKGTVGLFQLSTRTMSQYVSKVKIDNFNDIVASIALVRPGTRDNGLDLLYVRRKHGEDWEKQHPIYEEITKATFGICVYQEQVMEIIHKIAGLPYYTADSIRKIIAKKRDLHEFEKYEKVFLEGCEKTGYFNQEEAHHFWTELQAHANYSFSAGHSVGYAKLAYQTAWLRCYYPLEFFCASLTHTDDKDKKADLIGEIVKLNHEIVTPKIGYSEGIEWIVKDNKIFIPFREVRGFGPKTAPKIAQYAAPVGFFESEDKKKKPKKIDIILDEINAYDLNKKPTKIEFSDFDYELIIPWKEKQPRLNSIRQEFSLPDNYDDLFSCNDIKEDLITELEKPKQYLRGLGVCHECNLGKNCRAPVKPEFGKYNVMIIAEASHWVDDKKKIPLMSDEGTKALFPLLKKFGLTRDMFYVTTCIKCVTKKVMKEHIISCNDWLTKEIEYVKPKVVLAFGNTGLKYFKGVDSGIKRMNGVTEWNEEFDCWVCYCVRPVTALFDDTGKEELLVGIRNFVRKVRNLGLKEMRY